MSMPSRCTQHARKHAPSTSAGTKTCMRTNYATGQDRTNTGEEHKQLYRLSPLCVCEVYAAQVTK